MRVVSKHVDQGDGPQVNQIAHPPGRDPSPNSTQAQLQARLGQPGPRLPLTTSTTTRSPSAQPHQQQSMYLGHHQHQGGNSSSTASASSSGQVVSADLSAQRFTDWRSQSQQSKGNNNPSSLGNVQPSSMLPANQHQSQNPQYQQPLHQHQSQLPGKQSGHVPARNSQAGQSQWEAASNSSSGSSSQTLPNKAFSREGIQQTIDNVKNRWFKNDSDLISGVDVCSEEDEMDGDVTSYRFHPQPAPSPGQRLSQTPPRRLSGHHQSSSSPVTIPTSRLSSSSPAHRQSEEEDMHEYGSSLEKLNNSLTELQGEIMCLTLQNEQLKAGHVPNEMDGRDDGVALSDALAAIGSSSSPNPTSVGKGRPIHGIPVQAPYVHGSGGLSKPQQQHQQQQLLQQQQQSHQYHQQQQLQHQHQQQHQHQHQHQQQLDTTAGQAIYSEEPVTLGIGSGSDSSSGKDGFFISFGDDGNSTPKRPRSKLGNPKFESNANANISAGQPQQPPQPIQPPATHYPSSSSSEPEISSTPPSVQSGLNTTNNASDVGGDDTIRPESPAPVGYIIKESSSSPEKVFSL